MSTTKHEEAYLSLSYYRCCTSNLALIVPRLLIRSMGFCGLLSFNTLVQHYHRRGMLWRRRNNPIKQKKERRARCLGDPHQRTAWCSIGNIGSRAASKYWAATDVHALVVQ